MAQARRNKKFTTNKLTSIKKEILSFFLLVLSLLFLISIYSHDPGDPNFFNSGIASTVNNYIGIVGAYVSFFFFEIFGLFAYLFPVFLLLVIVKSFKEHAAPQNITYRVSVLFYFLLITATSCIILNFFESDGFADNNGYLLGGFIGLYLDNNIGVFIGKTGLLLASIALLGFSSSKYFKISISEVCLDIYKYLRYYLLRLKFILKSNIEKLSLHIEKIKQKEELSKNPLVKKISETAVELPTDAQHVSKREFKEKQRDLFLGETKIDLPLLEFLVEHGSEKVSYEDESLHNMSRLLETNLMDFNIEVEV